MAAPASRTREIIVSDDDDDMTQNAPPRKTTTTKTPFTVAAAAASSSSSQVPTAHRITPVKTGVALGTTYHLTAAEVARCYAIASARNAANVAGNKTNMNFSHRDDVLVSFQGACGEMACFRIFGLDDTGIDDTTCRNAMNDTFDGNLGGHSVDVKTVIRRDAGILVTEWKAKNPPRLYCLMYLDGLRYKDTYRPNMPISVTFCGLVPASWILKEENKKTLFAEQKTFYCYDQSDLVSWGYLNRTETAEQMRAAAIPAGAPGGAKLQSSSSSSATKVEVGRLFM
jgi:hypothetical protein